MKLKETFWLWGHVEGCFNNDWGNKKISRMTPMEGCLYLGIENIFMVPYSSEINMRQYNKSFKTLKNVSWEYCGVYNNKENMEDIIIKEAESFPNITSVVYDDFTQYKERYGKSMDNIIATRKKLKENHVRPLDMWMVVYTENYGLNEREDAELKEYLEYFDGATLWAWTEKEIYDLPEKFEKFKELTPGKRRLFGVYLWNFGDKKEMSKEGVRWQLDFCLEKIKKGEAHGIVFHNNALADLDYEAYDAALSWIEEHKNEEI